MELGMVWSMTLNCLGAHIVKDHGKTALLRTVLYLILNRWDVWCHFALTVLILLLAEGFLLCIYWAGSTTNCRGQMAQSVERRPV